MLLRVTLGLSGIVLATLAVKGTLATFRKSREWLVEQVRESLRREIK